MYQGNYTRWQFDIDWQLFEAIGELLRLVYPTFDPIMSQTASGHRDMDMNSNLHFPDGQTLGMAAGQQAGLELEVFHVAVLPLLVQQPGRGVGAGGGEHTHSWTTGWSSPLGRAHLYDWLYNTQGNKRIPARIAG